MADAAAEGRIQDLKRRLDLEPGSRLFVSLAEEYRKSGRLADALSTLQKGMLAHPNYLSAHVALGRAYLEAGQITEAIATFSKVLSADPGNLVSAKSLADIYLSRGDSVEAIKKYKLYRALSGDRSVDEIIERLEVELAPPPLPSSREAIPPPPPPTFYDGRPTGPIRGSRDVQLDAISGRPAADLDVTSVKFEPDDSASDAKERDEPASVPLSRDLPLAARVSVSVPTRPMPAAPAIETDALTQASPPGEAAIREAAPEEESPAGLAASTGEPQGRVLADLYFAQGHYAEALAIYDDLLASSPHNQDLRRLRRDSEARLLPAAAPIPAAASPDLALERRLAKVRALKRWLSVVQIG